MKTIDQSLCYKAREMIYASDAISEISKIVIKLRVYCMNICQKTVSKLVTLSVTVDQNHQRVYVRVLFGAV